MFSLEQVRAFVVIAEERNFRRAAERLQMTQPPLSRQIQKLEREIRVQLFDRTQRQVELTAAGIVFLTEARRLLALADAAPSTARLVAEGRAGTVRIGFTAASGFAFVGRFVGRIEGRVPGIRLVLSEMVSMVQLENLRSGNLDLALARPPFDEDEFESRLVYRESLVLAVPAGHRLADGNEPVAVDDLAGTGMLVYARPHARYFADLTARVLANVPYVSAHHLTQIHTMLALVSAGLGVALVPASAMHLHPDGVRFRELDGVENNPVLLYAVWREASPNPALQRVIPLLDTLPET